MTTFMSRSRGFLFIHNPKAAGSSIARALRRFDDHPVLNSEPVRKVRNRIGLGRLHAPAFGIETFRFHATAREVRDQIGAERFGALFRFVFVRNPWDLYVSTYQYIREARLHPRREKAETLEFPEFLAWWLDVERPSQMNYILDADGMELVDFVGRFERLEADFGEVCRRLGVAANLPHVNPSGRARYRDYYNDETKSLVARANAEEIKRFGYRF